MVSPAGTVPQIALHKLDTRGGQKLVLALGLKIKIFLVIKGRLFIL